MHIPEKTVDNHGESKPLPWQLRFLLIVIGASVVILIARLAGLF
jgi:hypothetical protein